jgi:hypothetical protein
MPQAATVQEWKPPPPYQLSRALHRKAGFRTIRADDVRQWLYAAYRMGGFELPEGFSYEEFEVAFYEWSVTAHEVYMLEAPLQDSQSARNGAVLPVGLVKAEISDHRMEAHAIWFPWSTTRNKIEATLAFLDSMRTRYLVLVLAKKEARRFFEQVMRYGILKRVGWIDDWYEQGEAVMAYHTRGLL